MNSAEHWSRLIPPAVIIAIVATSSPSLKAEEPSSKTRADGAVALYSDANTAAMLESMTVQRESGRLKLGISRRHPLASSSSDEKDKVDPLSGNETGLTLSGEFPLALDQSSLQDLSIAPRAGYLTNESGATKSKSFWTGAALSAWTGEQTIRWTLDIQRNFADATQLDVTDIDGKRILTPERIGGTSIGINWMHLATPEFLWRGGVSVISRDDRPEAHTASLEGRYFVAPANAAIHAAISRFENSGTVRPVTLTGSIEATSTNVEWHQKVGERVIVAPGYRWYRETEIPRASNGIRKTLGTDYVYASLRYRFWRDYWLEDSPEAFLTAGSYQTSSGTRIWQFAAGGSFYFNQGN